MGPDANQEIGQGLASRPWLLTYKTSSTTIAGRPLDILHDFYVPALSLTRHYDRVAGYFRSSSLAAASQGFSALVGRGGKMRFIVGADLDPEDVKAILEGDSRRLEDALGARLQQSRDWPSDVRSGVELLAWMVAAGYLEVKVAFRLHCQTQQPLPFDSLEDGYVHEKWLLFRDEYGNCLYASGTLNESKTALVKNAENIDIHCNWWGEIERQRINEAERSFEEFWRGGIPHLPVFSLPQAVQEQLLQLQEKPGLLREIDGTLTAAPDRPEPTARERLQFALIKDGPRLPGGRFVGMETAPVTPWPHQEVVVRRLVETWPYSYLLCDEVGLGKTIEAGLAFRSLYLSGLVQRILVAPPAGLAEQWHRQMADKLLLPFGLVKGGRPTRLEYIYPEPRTVKTSSGFDADLAIISTGLLVRPERCQELKNAQPFDIVLVDEAHAARRQNPTHGPTAHPDYGRLYVTIRDHLTSKAASLWLATATPMQLHPIEACDLLALTDRVGSFQFDPTLTLQYYELLRWLVNKEELESYQWEFLRQTLLQTQRLDPLLWQYLDTFAVDASTREITRRWLENQRVPRGRDRTRMTRLVFHAAPLSRVMLRHTRALLEIYRDEGQLQENLPRRHQLPLPRIVFRSEEERVYTQLEEYCDGLARQLRQAGDLKASNAIGFYASFLRLRFASSIYALHQTLKRRRDKVRTTLARPESSSEEAGEETEYELKELLQEDEIEDDSRAVGSVLKDRTRADLEWEQRQLDLLLDSMSYISHTSTKMEHLLQELDRRRLGNSERLQQTVIFTRFFDTLSDIVKQLRRVSPHMLLGTYSGQGSTFYNPAIGQMQPARRSEVKELFLRGELDILVCTDAAAEGLNLQTADLLINFDLGWNPMKVEQRIGRIDRIGQKHPEIKVLNLCYAGSAEELVYGRLLQRLREAGLIVGTQQIALLPVDAEEFAQLAQGTLSAEELEQRALEKLKRQKQQSESMEITPRELYDTYMRMSSSDNRPGAPLTLEDIWKALVNSTYLLNQGCISTVDAAGAILSVSGIDNLPSPTHLTSSRRLFEEGRAESSTPLHFASYGDPAFDAIVQHMNQYKLPPCVKRIAATLPDLNGAELVAYAVLTRAPGDVKEVNLIWEWNQLQDLHLAEEDTLADSELEPLREQLEQMARREFEHYTTAYRVERANKKAGLAQDFLSHQIAARLLEETAGLSAPETPFSQVIETLEAQERDSYSHQITLPASQPLQRAAEDSLFEITTLTGSNEAFVRLNPVLVTAALDSAQRQADSLKVKKSALSLAMLMNRLNRHLEQLEELIVRN